MKLRVVVGLIGVGVVGAVVEGVDDAVAVDVGGGVGAEGEVSDARRSRWRHRGDSGRDRAWCRRRR